MNTLDIVVVSVFDGHSTPRLAMESIPHLNVLRYYSSEIEKDPISVASRHFGQDDNFRLGDITKIDFIKLREEIKETYPKAKILLIGGSPCQNFSMMGRLKGSSTKCGIDVVGFEQYLELKRDEFEFEGQSFLFWEYYRARHELQPDYWVLENVRVSKKWRPMFDNAMGVKGVLFNSNTMSAQDRPRLYWSNLDIKSVIPDKPSDDKIVDILEDIPIDKELPPYMSKEFNGVSRLKKGIFNFTERAKGVTQTTGSGHGCKYIIKGNPDNAQAVRKLTLIEQERLQCYPDNYTTGCSNVARAKMIGNGMTTTVISAILEIIPVD